MMQAGENADTNESQLNPYLSPVGAWALALGTSIGWGSLVVTSNTYLLQAGPWGSVLGLLIGAAVMLVISRNYHYMINRFPDAGGVYAFAKKTFGSDHGFLAAWFLGITYIAIFWANATSLPLFARYFMGDLFQFGFSYSVFGYEVYLGEALLSLAAILAVALLCAKSRKGTMWLAVAFAAMFVVGITACFAASASDLIGPTNAADPGFIPDTTAFSQVIGIACISPWAFIGFESISHASEEYTFSSTKIFRIMVLAVLSATALYVFVILLSASAHPSQYGSWLEYIRDLGNLQGLEALPPFYAAYCHLGTLGVNLLMAALFALIASSLVGNMLSLSRLFYALAQDRVIPQRFARTSSCHIPIAAVALVAALSLLIPFLGRTAIGWIVDVTTIGAAMVYGFVSASAFKSAKEEDSLVERITGLAGIIFAAGFGAYLLLPGLVTASAMEKESFFLFTLWGILGIVYFRVLLQHDRRRSFGQSIIVWIALIGLVLVIDFIWMSQSVMASSENALQTLYQFLTVGAGASAQGAQGQEFLEQTARELAASDAKTMLMVMGLFVFSLALVLSNFAFVNRRARENEEELEYARSVANQDALTGVKSKHAYTHHVSFYDEQIQSGYADEFSVVVCDVNGLKQINDTLGHKAGDEYIRSAAKLICGLFPHSPVFRIGGDEFVVLLTGTDYLRRHETMAEFNACSERNARDGGVVIAAGMADYIPGSDQAVHEVFERSDALMYENKRMLKEG